MPDDSTDVGRPKAVTDDELVQAVTAIASAERVATTAEVADCVSAAPRTVQRRLRALHDEGRVQSKEVGARSRVWWVTHDHADVDP